jgi:hypothetical protein
MTNVDLLKLQRSGAEARALGRTFLDNPLLRSEAMPTATGDRTAEWLRKHDAWHLGWTAENAMRPS